MTTEPMITPHDPAGAAAVQEKPRFPWRLFFLLALMSVIATLLLIPYALKLEAIGNPDAQNNMTQVILGTILNAVILYWPLALLGIFFSRKVRLGAPYLQSIVEGHPAPSGFRRALAYAVAAGVVLGVVVLILAGLFNTLLPTEMTNIDPAQMPSALDGFMASISAGINEEILLRLFLLSLVAWAIQKIARHPDGRPNRAVLWTANILAAVIFGLLHLPNLTAIGVSITPILILYVILLNGLAGVGFGWLFWTFGLEAAMLAHFSADIVLHVIPQLLSGVVK